jgi:hypothetical protein
MTMTGPISDPPELTHRAELVEKHTIMADVPAWHSVPSVAVEAQLALVDDALAEARRWAEREGLELINLARVEHRLSTDQVRIGVSFDVVVGKGDLDPADARADDWRWSARMLHWRDMLANKTREGRRIVAREEAGRVVKFPGDGGVPNGPPWAGR